MMIKELALSDRWPSILCLNAGDAGQDTSAAEDAQPVLQNSASALTALQMKRYDAVISSIR